MIQAPGQTYGCLKFALPAEPLPGCMHVTAQAHAWPEVLFCCACKLQLFVCCFILKIQKEQEILSNGTY